ncbi:helix-turn-helix DNA binding domain protein [Gordonia phage Doggs]|nr:helix-turn-helix DNA binding domain protein [Gordonia phage Doggs]
MAVTRNIGAALPLCPQPPHQTGDGGFVVRGEVDMQSAGVLTPDGVDSLITGAEAARLCGVSTVTIRKWTHRGYVDSKGAGQRLAVAGRDRQGRNLYRMIDVAKAEHATRTRARRS